MKEQFVKEVETNLRDNILTYWSDKMADPRGGFYGRRDGSDRLDEEAPKGAILNARILWAFSAAYRVLGDKKYLNMATRAKDEIIGRFYDREFGESIGRSMLTVPLLKPRNSFTPSDLQSTGYLNTTAPQGTLKLWNMP